MNDDKLSLFFSDLDRTLIYSKQFVSDGIDTVPVEFKENRVISFMTKKGYSLLQRLLDHRFLIPVTTRTWDEVLRINWMNQTMPPIVICHNGGTIYRNGVRDQLWDEYIRSLQAKSYPINELLILFQQLYKDEELRSIENVDNYFLLIRFYTMTEKVLESLNVLNTTFQKQGLSIEYTDKKVYVMPVFLRKEIAVLKIIAEMEPNLVIGAGDSTMDHHMLMLMDKAISPLHRTFETTFIRTTKNEGIIACEEILDYVWCLLSDTSDIKYIGCEK